MVNIIDLLKELCRKIKKISDEKFDVASLQNICDGKELRTFVSETTQNCTVGQAILIGNMLRLNFSTTGLPGIEAGNVANELVAKIGITPSYPDFLTLIPLFNSLYGGRINSGSSGGIASFSKDVVFDNDSISNFVYVSVYITATHQSISSTNSYFTVPVGLDTTPF